MKVHKGILIGLALLLVASAVLLIPESVPVEGGTSGDFGCWLDCVKHFNQSSGTYHGICGNATIPEECAGACCY